MSPDKQPKNKNLLPGRWKKGQSGNPKGRPRKANCLLSCIKSELEKRDNNNPELTNVELIAGIVVDKCKAGNEAMIKLLLEYTCQKPVQGVNPDGAEGGQTQITEAEVRLRE
jgi:hypothetical protein